MKLATFLAPGASDPQAGEVRGDEIVAFEHGTVLDRIASGDREPATGATHRIESVTFLAPIPRPPAIFCIGRNYAAHIAELKSEKPDKPLVFLKLPRSSAPPGGPVIRPAGHPRRSTTRPSSSWSWAATTRSPATRSPTTSPPETSSAPRSSGRARRASTRPAPGARGSRPTPTRSDLRITTHVNGEQRQDGSTSDLIFKPDELVAFIAETCTLEPGAIILTGTPSGVGEAFDPPRYLQPGDVVRCEVEGLGALEHSISEIG